MAQPNTILLTSGAVCLVSPEDLEELLKYNWFECKGSHTSYAACTISGKTVRMHRLLLGATRGVEVDHINSNGLDNRRENLRLVTRSENRLNKSKEKNCLSTYIGVTFDKARNKWLAQGTIAELKMRKAIGRFNTELEAAKAYNEFCLRYNPYSKLNIL